VPALKSNLHPCVSVFVRGCVCVCARACLCVSCVCVCVCVCAFVCACGRAPGRQALETLKWLSLGNMCAGEIFAQLEPREKSPQIKYCMYVCVCVCGWVCIHVCICVSVHIHTYIQTGKVAADQILRCVPLASL